MHWTSGDVSAVAAAGTALGLMALWTWRKGFRPVIRFILEFRDDWQGVPARPGVPGHPGVMERLGNIEGQLKPNGGASMHDAVNRIEQQLSTPPPAPVINIHQAGKEQQS